MIPDSPIAQNPARHLRILGICWLLYGILRIVTAVWLALFSSTATLMFGALLNRVPDPFSLMNIFHIAYGVLVAISAACGILGALLDQLSLPGPGPDKLWPSSQRFFLSLASRSAQRWEFIRLLSCWDEALDTLLRSSPALKSPI
jgi:hypothetical protein